jgi:hypothetical protein
MLFKLIESLNVIVDYVNCECKILIINILHLQLIKSYFARLLKLVGKIKFKIVLWAFR